MGVVFKSCHFKRSSPFHSCKQSKRRERREGEGRGWGEGERNSQKSEEKKEEERNPRNLFNKEIHKSELKALWWVFPDDSHKRETYFPQACPEFQVQSSGLYLKYKVIVSIGGYFDEVRKS